MKRDPAFYLPGRSHRLACLILAVLSPLLISACATAEKGTTQSISVKLRAAEQGMSAPTSLPCRLSNEIGQWDVVVPGDVMVKRSRHPLIINCENTQWVMAQDSADHARPDVSGSLGKGAAIGAGVGSLWALAIMAVPIFGPAMAVGVFGGSVLIGGVSGSVVDGVSGAMYDYSPEITVVVRPRADITVEPSVPAAELQPTAVKQL